jgi:hypothetical protein
MCALSALFHLRQELRRFVSECSRVQPLARHTKAMVFLSKPVRIVEISSCRYLTITLAHPRESSDSKHPFEVLYSCLILILVMLLVFWF